MPFRLYGAAATSQRLINWVLAPHQCYAAASIDDTINYTNDWRLNSLRAVQELWSTGLTTNPGKCALGKAKMKYFGFLVGQGCICPLIHKIEAIRDYPPPQTWKQLRAFLGLASYYRLFIPYFAEVTALLTDLLKGWGNGPLKWDEEHRKAFHKTQQSLCNKVVLHTPDFRHPFILQTDACNQAVGAVLTWNRWK